MRLHDVKCGAAGAKMVRDSTSPTPAHLDRCLMLEITAQDRFVHLCQITLLIFCSAADARCDGIIMYDMAWKTGSLAEKKTAPNFDFIEKCLYTAVNFIS